MDSEQIVPQSFTAIDKKKKNVFNFLSTLKNHMTIEIITSYPKTK